MWADLLKEKIDLKVGGHVFTDEELQIFCILENSLTTCYEAVSTGLSKKFDLNICSSCLGEAEVKEQASTSQHSFRRDITIVCDSAGVRGHTTARHEKVHHAIYTL